MLEKNVVVNVECWKECFDLCWMLEKMLWLMLNVGKNVVVNVECWKKCFD